MLHKQSLLLSAIITLVCFTQQANAKIWRVNNKSNYNGSTFWGENFGGNTATPVFAQLNEPNGSALVQAGDTIHLEGSIDNYDAVYITKKLIIIGPGYLLQYNPNTSNDLLQAKINWISFNATSAAGSQLIGAYITSSNGITIATGVSNITIKRCRIDYDIAVNYANADIYIIGNFFSNTSSTASAISTNGNGFPVNFIFNNNICQRTLLLSSNVTIFTALECKNNVFDCPALTGGNPSIKMLCNNFQNNILKTPGAAVEINNNIPSGGVSYNISASSIAQFGSLNNNVVIADQTTLFITSASLDGKYQLKSSSPGSNNGSDGTDRGAFGGLSVSNRYTLSGLAPIPVIYDISTSGVADATGLPVTIKARTIK